MICQYCNTPDGGGNYSPCCNEGDGRCEGDSNTMMCNHCGAEMFIEDNKWFHHSQQDTPIEERRIQYGN